MVAAMISKTICLVFLGTICAAQPALAIVGESESGARFASHVVMVLTRDGARAGFCSGVVIAERVVLTAAHCAGASQNLRLYIPSPGSEPKLTPVARIAVHPGYRTNAVARREKSIDLALIEAAELLPRDMRAVSFSNASETSALTIAGYGIAVEGDPKSGGTLRSATLRLREPVSNVLLWLEGAGQNTGACTGDSGAPVFASDGGLAAIVAFAEGAKRTPLRQANAIHPHCPGARVDYTHAHQLGPLTCNQVVPNFSSLIASKSCTPPPTRFVV